jgi:hypothetical protein
MPKKVAIAKALRITTLISKTLPTTQDHQTIITAVGKIMALKHL